MKSRGWYQGLNSHSVLEMFVVAEGQNSYFALFNFIREPYLWYNLLDCKVKAVYG